MSEGEGSRRSAVLRQAQDERGGRHEDRRLRIGFVGAGRLAHALALGLAERDYRIVAVASLGGASAAALASRLQGCQASASAQAVVDGADLVFLAVPDDAIGDLAGSLSWRADMAVVHCSGALSVEALRLAADAGASTGGFHPLQTLADLESGREALDGSSFALEGEEPLLSLLDAMARVLGGQPLRLEPGHKALYHASAVLASNYVVALANRASELWGAFGYSRAEALSALLPLLRGTVDNLDRLGLPAALTGPIARGDAGTIRRHLQALTTDAPQARELYCRLGLETLPLAVEKASLTDGAAEELRELFTAACVSREVATCE